MAISDRIAVMQSGSVAQCGTAEQLYRRPTSRFVAGFLGRTNLVAGVVFAREAGSAVVEVGGARVALKATDAPPPGSAVCAVIRPEALSIGPSTTAPSATGLAATVVSGSYLGEKVEYMLEWRGLNLLVVRSNPPADERFVPGDAVWVQLPEEGVPLLQD
jgi:ABC-type Fe3+/spermidine/putrescine transport system ATPase subunit